MTRRIVILHGWSDCSESFVHVKAFLRVNGIGDVSTIYYADYESREDNITFEDIAGGLNDELRAQGVIDAVGHGDFNVVVHSTGGLVIRHWIWRYYHDRLDECPVKNLVMLAPANFGSPLAHRGKSFLGQLFKGRWKIGDFLEVGRQLLDGLELGSSYQWQLAHRDLLGADAFYDAETIRLTVLVGLDDYTGLRGWVNKPGTDGTVVIAGTPLNSIKVRLDFTNPDVPLRWTTQTQHGLFGFGALRGYDHGSIVDTFANHRAEPEQPVLVHALRALQVRSAAEFRSHCEELRQATRANYDSVSYEDPTEIPRRFQQFLLHAIDDQGASIRDFTVEFFVRRSDRAEERKTLTTQRTTRLERELSDRVHGLLTSEFHTFSRDSSYRRLLVDVKTVQEVIPPGHLLAMRICVPRVDRGIYYDTRNMQDIVLWEPGTSTNKAPAFFFSNTTTLIELVVDRVTQYVTLATTPRTH